MKTQRMDAEYKRLQEEIARRELQRKLFYENKRDAHKKLYSRVLAKNFLSGIEDTTMRFFTETSNSHLQRLLQRRGQRGGRRVVLRLVDRFYMRPDPAQ